MASDKFLLESFGLLHLIKDKKSEGHLIGVILCSISRGTSCRDGDNRNASDGYRQSNNNRYDVACWSPNSYDKCSDGH